MAYGVWLSYNNQQEGFQFPVTPSSIEMSDSSSGTTYDIIELGEINVIKYPKLTTYQFGGIFPAQLYPFVEAPLLRSVEVATESEVRVKTNPYVDYITRWMATRRPVRLVFTGDTFDINVAVSIDSFDWKEIAGSSGDIEYSLKLTKYVFYAARRIVFQSESDGSQKIVTAAEPRADELEQPKTYTLRAGDSLWKVAKNVLGSGDRWRDIQKLNGLTDAQLRTLPIGKVLKLPT